MIIKSQVLFSANFTIDHCCKNISSISIEYNDRFYSNRKATMGSKREAFRAG